MDMQLQTNKIIKFIIVNSILVLLLYTIPVENNQLLENICIFKKILNLKCFNCGMTRAFLYILHGDLIKAIYFNKNVIIVFGKMKMNLTKYEEMIWS